MYSMWSKYTSLVLLDEDIPNGPDDVLTQEMEVLVSLKDPLPLESYKKLRIHPYRESRKTVDGSDFSTSHTMVMSERAMEVLKDLILNDGIFYPLNAIGVDQNYFLFHVTRIIDCIDEERSKGSLNIFKKINIKYSSIDTFYLKKEMIPPGVHVFKDGRYGNHYKFVSEDFYMLVKKNKLKGLLLYPEGVSQWTGKPLIVNKSLASKPDQVVWG